MTRRDFLKVVGAGIAVIAVPTIPRAYNPPQRVNRRGWVEIDGKHARARGPHRDIRTPGGRWYRYTV